MEPVINPWLFYFIEMVDAFEFLAVAVFVVDAVLFSFGIAKMLVNKEHGEKDGDYLEGKKAVKISIVVTVIVFVIIIIVPSSDTIIKMVIAKNVTYDALDAAKDVVIQVYNDILALFQK